MKIRHGFVSNSSSSSFIVSIDALTETQIEKLLEYNEKSYHGDGWRIDRDDHSHLISGFTIMDNGDMSEYMRDVCEIDMSLVRFEGE